MSEINWWSNCTTHTIGAPWGPVTMESIKQAAAKMAQIERPADCVICSETMCGTLRSILPPGQASSFLAMPVLTTKTELGAILKARLLAQIDGCRPLLLLDDGHAIEAWKL